jgi:hypothetical protein
MLHARKYLLAGALGVSLGAFHTAAAQPAPADATANEVLADRPHPHEQSLLDDLSERTFRFFWETANPGNGLVPDRWPTPSFSSIAAVGFGLTAYPVGVERGYITREQARERTLATLRFFEAAPQGPEPAGVSGYKGFFYHFLDMETGERYARTELSTVDTALLLAGVLFAQSYFTDDHPEEAELRELAEVIYARVDWPWAQADAGGVTLAWYPEKGFHASTWTGYNEAMIVYLLALGAPPEHALDRDAWEVWTKPYDDHWGKYYDQEHLMFSPGFGHQYSHIWVDFRDIQDAYMRERGIDYFENSRRAAYAQYAYAEENPLGWKGYGDGVWGLTASDGPGHALLRYEGEERQFRGYAARGIGYPESDGALGESYDDGTIAPTAAAGSIVFAPELAIRALREMRARYGKHIYSEYGFLDSFNPSFTYDVELNRGRVIPGFGWVADDYLGIDQGPILLMVENHRSGFVWEVMRQNPHIRRGLIRAGFTGGWLEEDQEAAQ